MNKKQVLNSAADNGIQLRLEISLIRHSCARKTYVLGRNEEVPRQQRCHSQQIENYIIVDEFIIWYAGRPLQQVRVVVTVVGRGVVQAVSVVIIVDRVVCEMR